MFRDSGTYGFSGAMCACAALVIAAVLLSSSARAQIADTSDIDAYLQAITQKDPSTRLARLERFASAASPGSLRTDALQWIVWGERQAHNNTAALKWARELLKVDAGNALALAVVADTERQSAQEAPARYPAHEEMAKRGLANLARLRRPEAMSYADFVRMRQEAEALLNGAAGAGALQRKDYGAARFQLSKAVAAAPNDASLVYCLALADLSGKKADRQQGYWLLARAANLSRGAPTARQIEELGRKKYKKDGGTDHEWNQYLAVTAAPEANAATVAVARGNHLPAAVETGQGVNRSTRVATNHPPTAAADVPAKKNVELADNRLPPSWNTGWKREPEPAPESSEAANSLPPIPDGPPRVARTGAPVSLGILIETSVATKGTRDAIIYNLTDLVRRLGADDEAFILSFSHNLVFEQDLTGDANRLAQAMEHIKPQEGAALMDAAGFAAGHLRRISKNDNRILLVVSDGQNASSRIPALASSNEIRASGVKIYCIGVDVAGSDGMYRLQGLASATGGTASFVTAPNQFRAAAQQVAGHIGIRFDY